MRYPKLPLLVVLLSAGVLLAQSSAQSSSQIPSQPKTPDLATPLPVPGGGAGLGPGGLPKPEDQHTPTMEETRRRIKEQGDQIADLQARRLAQQLNLNEAQLNRVRAIFIEREDQLRKAVAPETAVSDHPLTPQERKLKIQEIKDASLKRLQMVLNPDQRQQFETMMAHSNAERARRAAMAQRSRAPIAGGATAPGATQTPAAPSTAPAPAAATTPATPPQ